MNQMIGEKVDVVMANNTPLSIHWRNRDYKVTKVGLRHDYYEGKILVHVFSLLSESLFLKIKFDTKHLSWVLIEISEYAI